MPKYTAEYYPPTEPERVSFEAPDDDSAYEYFLKLGIIYDDTPRIYNEDDDCVFEI